MINRGHLWLHALAVLVTCLAPVGATPVQQDGRLGGTGTIEVTVSKAANDQGQILINLFLSPEGFPSDPKRAFRAIARAIHGGETRVVLESVPAGEFAVAAFHDENGNFRLDTNVLRIPKERWGVSRDARRRMGPPEFDAAALTLQPGQTVTVAIVLR